MPRRNSAGNLPQHTPVRRSTRLLQSKSCSRSQEQNLCKSKPRNSRASSVYLPRCSISSPISLVEVSPEEFLESSVKKSRKLSNGSSDCVDRIGLRRSEVLSDGDDGALSLRRSPRIMSKGEEEKAGQNRRTGKSRKVSTLVLDVKKSGRDSCGLSDRKKDEVCADSSKKIAVKSKTEERRSCVGTANEIGSGTVSPNSGKNKRRSRIVDSVGKSEACADSSKKNAVKSKTEKRRSCVGNANEIDSGKVSPNSGKSKRGSRIVDSVGKSGNEKGTNSTDKHVEENKRSICLGLRALTEEERRSLGNVACQGNKEPEAKLKRKCREEENGVVQGWTKDQEMALHRAYFAAKPTPHFWKKVSKLVPGKSEQDCFDKIHSNLMTPLQHQPRSRGIGINSSPIEHFSLSASKLLESAEPKNKKSKCNKQKSRVTQKKVRQLLQTHHHVNQDNDADMFSILEPDINSSTQVLPDIMLSTPVQLLKKQDFLHNCHETSSSGLKKTRSRFKSSLPSVLASPPVLKPIKNKALHEKYIDRLHFREAKRKAKSVQTQVSSDKENKRPFLSQNVDVVRTAKSALVSDARDAINQLKNLQTDTISDSSDLNGNCGASEDDDEGDIEI